MSKKVLTVATEVQKAVLINVLLSEIAVGFWKNARPADHADSWKGIEIVVGTSLGAEGFDVPRNYNFVNPEFFKKSEAALLEAAQTVDPEITIKALKKQLISLNQILGARLKEIGGVVTKLPRGRKQAEPAEAKTTTKAATTTRKVAANFAPEVTDSEGAGITVTAEVQVEELETM